MSAPSRLEHYNVGLRGMNCNLLLMMLVLAQGWYLGFDPMGYASRVKRISMRSGIKSGSPFQTGILSSYAAAAAKSLQLCLTLCNPIDGSPPGSPIPGILQARTLEWVAIAFSIAWKWKVKEKSLSCVRLFATRGLQPTRLPRPWDFPGKSTRVGCHRLLQSSL